MAKREFGYLRVSKTKAIIMRQIVGSEDGWTAQCECHPDRAKEMVDLLNKGADFQQADPIAAGSHYRARRPAA